MTTLGVPVPLRQVVAEAAALLAGAGVESPRWDAEQLVSHVLDVKRTSLPAIPNVTADQYATLLGLVQRRAAREPLQHIIGSVGFRYVELAVGKGVFTPRPETESVAGAAIDAARKHAAPVVVDLCSGSGAIAISVAHEVKTATVHAVEVDDGALEWLRRNASGRDNLTVHAAAVTGALPELDGAVDVVVSNPPYVPLADLATVEPEVRDFDPTIALVAGPDGLDVIREVEKTAYRLLKPGGTVVVEHADRQGESAPAVFESSRWSDVEDNLDLVGRPRYVTATKMVP